MAALKKGDFYYGSILSALFKKGMTPALVESDDDRQIFDVGTNEGDFRLYIKCCSTCSRNDSDAKRWVFSFSPNDAQKLKQFIDEGRRLTLALVGAETEAVKSGEIRLTGGEYAILYTDEIRELFLDKVRSSLTIKRNKNGRRFMIPDGKGKANEMRVKTNRNFIEAPRP